jgi:hypothetical protein
MLAPPLPTSVYFDECQMPISRINPEPTHFETQKCMIPTYTAPPRMDDYLGGTCQWPAPFQCRIRIRFPPLHSLSNPDSQSGHYTAGGFQPTEHSAPGTSTPYPRLGFSSHTYPADDGPHHVLLTFLAWTADVVADQV